MPEQITDLAELEGKTIERAVALPLESSTADDPFAIGLIFTDGTYVYLHACETYDHDLSITCEGRPTQPDELVALGFMTPEQRDRRKAEAEAYRVELNRKHEYQNYLRLKAIFDPEAPR